MIKLLRRLLGLCTHQWTVLHRVPVYEQEHASKPIGFSYELQCKHCGDVKFKEG